MNQAKNCNANWKIGAFLLNNNYGTETKTVPQIWSSRKKSCNFHKKTGQFSIKKTKQLLTRKNNKHW